ncbi:uncharacterized protein TNCV_369341 [Trichonephila clavipes]|nr:uncharacterized protein TNCV_369341 [Trichonephila clavipes]
MDDNATCHRTLAIQDCLDSKGIQRLVWPARSPDLNPIENVWDALGRQVAGRNYPPTNKNTHRGMWNSIQLKKKSAQQISIVCVSKLKTCMYSSKENSTERVRDLQENFFMGNGEKNLTDMEEGSYNDSLPDFNSWIVTVSSLSLAAMFAITGGAFAIVNAIRNSAEMVFGFLGILIWNTFGILCGTVSIFSWIILYLSKFRKNVMTLEELEQHWVSEFRSCVGFSFYLVVISTALFIVNVAIISTIIKQPWVDRKLRSKAEFTPRLSASSVRRLANQRLHLGRNEVSDWLDARHSTFVRLGGKEP